MMVRNTTTKSIPRWGPFAAALVPVALALIASGCSSVVDPNTSTPPESNVRNYYLPLATTNTEYDYTVNSTAPYHPASGALAMTMQGCSDTDDGVAVYACLWTYGNNYGAPAQWYYCLCDTEAAEMGMESSPEQYSDSWIDLKANAATPLELNATWSFLSQGEQITAKVTQYGSTAKVEGKTYTNVMMVAYTGANGTTGTEWFARGVGTIFYHVERPNFGMVENHLIQVKQP